MRKNEYPDKNLSISIYLLSLCYTNIVLYWPVCRHLHQIHPQTLNSNKWVVYFVYWCCHKKPLLHELKVIFFTFTSECQMTTALTIFGENVFFIDQSVKINKPVFCIYPIIGIGRNFLQISHFCMFFILLKKIMVIHNSRQSMTVWS